MKTYYFHKTDHSYLFFELNPETERVLAFTMHCDPAICGTLKNKNHKGVWVELEQICDAKMTIFLSSAKYNKLTCTQREAFNFQHEKREQMLEEIIARYNEKE